MSGTRQVYRSVTADRRRLKRILTAILIAAVAIGLAVFGISRHYTPPVHEAYAVEGQPVPDESYLYRKVTSDYGYSFYMAANLYRQADGSVKLYLTDPAESDVDILCKIYDIETDELLFESGRICPGEYLEELPVRGEYENRKSDVKVSVYAFDREDFRSEGTTELSLVLQPW